MKLCTTISYIFILKFWHFNATWMSHLEKKKVWSLILGHGETDGRTLSVHKDFFFYFVNNSYKVYTGDARSRSIFNATTRFKGHPN